MKKLIERLEYLSEGAQNEFHGDVKKLVDKYYKYGGKNSLMVETVLKSLRKAETLLWKKARGK